MRWPVIGPGRVGAPVLEEGDSVALADRHGLPVGEWVRIVGDCAAVRLRVPDGVGPVKCYLVRDGRGRVAWWSDATWHPAAMPGQWVHLPVRREWPHILPDGYDHPWPPAATEQAGKAHGRRPSEPRPGPPPSRPAAPTAVRWSKG